MGRRKVPRVSIIHHVVKAPKFTKDELKGLREQALSLEKHIDILEEEIKIKKAHLQGINSILNQ